LSKIALWIASALLLFAQTDALLPAREAVKLCERVTQLMEATGIAIPELARAGAPVAENAKQALTNLRSSPGMSHAGYAYTFLSNAKAFLALSDAVPKPFPLQETTGKQLVELREASGRIEAHFRALLEQKERQLRNPDRDNLRRYAEANGNLPAPQANSRVVFLGDSITDGWRLNQYFQGRDFVNRGISGQITGEMLGRFKADVIDLKPGAFLILAGTNDLARGVRVNVIQNNLSMMVDLALAHNIKPILASVLPIHDYNKSVNPQFEQSPRRSPELIRTLNTWMERYASDKHIAYLDYYSAMVDASGFLQRELADDGLHPNSAGYRVMAPLALAAIEKTLSPAPAGQRRR